MQALFFWLISFGMLGFALAVIFNRNAVASALCFTFTIIFMSGLFILLSAYFLASVQILVTAGAVMVLFLFIIMLLDLTEMEHAPRHWIWTACSALVALAFLGLVARTLGTIPTQTGGASFTSFPVSAGVSFGGKAVDEQITQSDIDRRDDTHRIGTLLFATKPSRGQTAESFTSYVAPFEITSLLILVATVGIIVLCKQDDRPRPRRREEITREAPPVPEERESALKT